MSRSRLLSATLSGLLLVMLAAIFLPPGSALAHSGLLRSDPPIGATLGQAPDSIHLWFSEEVHPVRPAITLFTASGRKIETGPIEINGQEMAVKVALPGNGTYLVRWQVLSEDTHPVRGQFYFSVGQADSGLNQAGAELGQVWPGGLVLQTISRWLHFLGFALGFGPVVFSLLVSRNQNEQAEEGLWRLVNAGIILLLVAEPLALLGQSASFGTEQMLDSSVIGDVLAANFGRVLGQRLGLALVLWILAGLARQGSKVARLAIPVTGLVLAIADGQSGHAINFGLPGVAINAFHLAAMGVWVGGLAGLLVSWNYSALTGKGILRRFGRLAGVATVMLVATGIAEALLQIKLPEYLLSTNYGQVLLVKLVVAGGVFLLAGFGLRSVLQKRRRWWLAEIAALGLILLLAGLLVSLPVQA